MKQDTRESRIETIARSTIQRVLIAEAMQNSRVEEVRDTFNQLLNEGELQRAANLAHEKLRPHVGRQTWAVLLVEWLADALNTERDGHVERVEQLMGEACRFAQKASTRDVQFFDPGVWYPFTTPFVAVG